MQLCCPLLRPGLLALQSAHPARLAVLLEPSHSLLHRLGKWRELEAGQVAAQLGVGRSLLILPVGLGGVKLDLALNLGSKEFELSKQCA